MKPGIRNVPAPYRAGDRPKGEQVFMQKLHKFMAGRGTPIGRLPSLGFKQRNTETTFSFLIASKPFKNELISPLFSGFVPVLHQSAKSRRIRSGRGQQTVERHLHRVGWPPEQHERRHLYSTTLWKVMDNHTEIIIQIVCLYVPTLA